MYIKYLFERDHSDKTSCVVQLKTIFHDCQNVSRRTALLIPNSLSSIGEEDMSAMSTGDSMSGRYDSEWSFDVDTGRFGFDFFR